jgi:hypothetical protein
LIEIEIASLSFLGNTLNRMTESQTVGALGDLHSIATDRKTIERTRPNLE